MGGGGGLDELHVELSDFCHLDLLSLMTEPCLTFDSVSDHVLCYHALTSAGTVGNYGTFVLDVNVILVFHSIILGQSNIELVGQDMWQVWVRERCVQRFGWGETERKRELGRTVRRCEDNAKIDFKEIRWERVDWIDVAQDTDKWRALVDAVMKLWVP